MATAEHLDQLIMDDLDDHLPRRDAFDDLLTHGAFLHRVDEVAHDRQRHIGLEQCDTHLAHRGRDIFLRQRPAALQAIEDVAQAFGQ